MSNFVILLNVVFSGIGTMLIIDGLCDSYWTKLGSRAYLCIAGLVCFAFVYSNYLLGY